MCEIYLDKPSEIKTGYKMLAQNIQTGELFSSFTGLPFNIGVVHKAPVYCKRLANCNTILDSNDLASVPFYNETYNGFSAACLTIPEALNIRDGMNLHESSETYRLVIVKITFNGIVHKGMYNGNIIIAGNNVKSLKVLSENYLKKIMKKHMRYYQ